jgi:hypothetical protein
LKIALEGPLPEIAPDAPALGEHGLMAGVPTPTPLENIAQQ